VIETAPWGFTSANNFLNAVILCLTDKTPREVLQLTQQIEREMGRKQKSVTAESQPSKPYSGQSRQDERQAPKYADRPIDIDILLYDDLHINTPKLTIPHPLMYERDFVLIPLKEILLTNDTDQ
jgi:2-amino-4-hydroxy-6-hydroxymethyldihydropteridine diphosphokinase